MLKEKLKKTIMGWQTAQRNFPSLHSLALSGLPKGLKKMAQFPFFTQFGTFWLARGAERGGSSLAFSNRR